MGTVTLFYGTSLNEASQVKNTGIISNKDGIILCTSAKRAISNAKVYKEPVVVVFGMNIHALDTAKMLSLAEYELRDELGNLSKSLNINGYVEVYDLESAVIL